MALKRKQKLEDYFINSLEYDKFVVKGIRKSNIVSSFKMRKLSEYAQQEIEAVERILTEEKNQSDTGRNDRTVTSF